jgi:hypothetical protein
MTHQEKLAVAKQKVDALKSSYIEVSKETFYSTIGQLNVHPHIESKHDDILGYFETWKLLENGKILGASIGGTTFSKVIYFVTPEFNEQIKKERR